MKSAVILVSAAALLVAAGAARAEDWAGPYAGIIAAYNATSTDTQYDDPGLILYDVSTDPVGWSVGGVVGLNFVVDGPLLFGVEGEIGAANVTDTIDDTLGGGSNTITATTDYYTSLRARFGLPMDAVLPYAVGGVTLAHTTVSASDGDISDEALIPGYTAGLGVELALGDDLSVRLEYQHTEFVEHTWFDGDPWSSTGKGASNAVRFGMTYGF